MASIVVGSVAVDVVPNATNFARDLRGQIEGPVDAVGQDVGQNLSDTIIEHLADSIPEGLSAGIPESAEIGDSAGAKFGDAFSTQIRTRIDAALKSLPEAHLGLDDTEAMGKIADIRDQLMELSQNELDVSLTDDEALAKLRELRDQLAAIALESPDIRVRIDAAKAQAELDELIAKFAALDAMSLAVHPDDALSNIGAEAQKATASVSSTGSSIGALGPILAGVALIAAPVLGVLISGAADLAIGIKNAHVETGTLTGAWQGLEEEAGKAIKPGLQDAVTELAASLPALNPLIDTLSTDLGSALDKAATWLNDGGAKEIVDYLKTEIPIVGGLFESLGSAVAGFISVTQGPANLLLGIFTGIAQAAKQVEDAVGSVSKGQLPSSGSSPNSPDYAFGDHSVTVAGAQIDVPGAFLLKDAYKDIKNSLPTSTPQSSSLASQTYGTQAPSYPVLPLSASVIQHATNGPDHAPPIGPNGPEVANAQAMGATISGYQNATAAAAKFAAQTQINTQTMSAENDAAGLVAQALSGIGGHALGVAQANTAFETSMLTINSTLKQNGYAIDGNSKSALANQTALEGIVAQAQAVYTATAEQTGSTVQAKAAYDSEITSLENAVGATGKQKAAIQQYIGQISDIPTSIKTEVDFETSEALLNIHQLSAQIGNLDLQAAGIAGNIFNAEFALQKDRKDGGILHYYANGGMENHIAEMAPAGAMRVWAEPETGGESYIPLASSKRARSEAILSQTANLFGGAYIPKGARNFADGMVLRGSAGVGSSAGAGHSHPINVLLDGRKITKAVNEQNGWNNRL